MSRGLYWILAPVLVLCLIAFPLLINAWTPTTVIVMVALELFCVGLLLGLWDLERFSWALRGVAGIIFLAYVAYLINMLMAGSLLSARRSTPSAVNAIGGLLFWGIPSFWFAVRGFGKPNFVICFATSNPLKLDEVRAILEPTGFAVMGLDDIQEDAGRIAEPVEDGDTFEANARIKAIAYAKEIGHICLADDSGLEVDALGGRPGVHSARYAGIGATRAERDAANNEKLLHDLERVPDVQRTARFVCAMCLADPHGRVLAETRGEFPGVIAPAPRGANGFGYDPLLHLPDRGCTSAELSTAEKNARSHRGAAARKMAAILKNLKPQTNADTRG